MPFQIISDYSKACSETFFLWCQQTKEYMPKAISVKVKINWAFVRLGLELEQSDCWGTHLNRSFLSKEPVPHRGGGQRRISWHTIPPRLASTSGPDPEVRRSHQLTCHSLCSFFLLWDFMASSVKWLKPPPPSHSIPSTLVCHYLYPEFPSGETFEKRKAWLNQLERLYSQQDFHLAVINSACICWFVWHYDKPYIHIQILQ